MTASTPGAGTPDAHTPPPPSGALSPAQRDALAAAEIGLKSVRRADRLAGINAWTMGIFAGITVLFGLGDPFSMAVGLSLGAVAWNEFQGRALLQKLDPEGARRLAWNQIAIMGVVTVYCGVQIWKALYGTPDASMAQLEELAGFEPGWLSELTATAYVAVVVIVDGIQLLTARFHFRRQAELIAWRRETPPWVREVLELKGGAAG